MVKVMYTDQLVYKVDFGAFLGISLWKEEVALICLMKLFKTICNVIHGIWQGKLGIKRFTSQRVNDYIVRSFRDVIVVTNIVTRRTSKA